MYEDDFRGGACFVAAVAATKRVFSAPVKTRSPGCTNTLPCVHRCEPSSDPFVVTRFIGSGSNRMAGNRMNAVTTNSPDCVSWIILEHEGTRRPTTAHPYSVSTHHDLQAA